MQTRQRRRWACVRSFGLISFSPSWRLQSSFSRMIGSASLFDGYRIRGIFLCCSCLFPAFNFHLSLHCPGRKIKKNQDIYRVCPVQINWPITLKARTVLDPALGISKMNEGRKKTKKGQPLFFLSLPSFTSSSSILSTCARSSRPHSVDTLGVPILAASPNMRSSCDQF